MVPPQYGNYGGAPRGPKQNIQEAAQELAERKHRESRYLASKYDARGLGSTEAGGWLEDEYKVEPRAHVDRTEAAERLAAVKHPFPWAAEANQRWAAASTHANRASQEPMRGHGKRLYKASEDPTRPQALPPLMPRLHRPGRRSPTLNLFAGNPSYEPRAARHPGAQQSSVFSAGEGKAYDYIDRKKPPRLYENAYKKLNSTVFSQHGAAGGGGGGLPTSAVGGGAAAAALGGADGAGGILGEPAPAGDAQDLGMGVLVGFLLGFVAMICLVEGSVSQRMRLGICIGVSLQLAATALRVLQAQGAGGQQAGLAGVF